LANKLEKRIKQFQKYLPKPDKLASIYRCNYFLNELPKSSLKLIENEGHF